jgi:4-hydroxythreonine-4-phosphate dehydrogenase
VIGSSRAISAVWNGPVISIGAPDEAAAAFATGLPCLEIELAGEVTPGQPDADGAHCALHALEMGIGLAKSGAAAALVTAPVGKSQLYAVGFTHPGQTEFIAERCGISRENAVMMLAGPSLRVIPVTIHMPLRDVPDALSIELIRTRALVTVKGLCRNFGIAKPRLVVAGSIRTPERAAIWAGRRSRSSRPRSNPSAPRGWTSAALMRRTGCFTSRCATPMTRRSACIMIRR